jgi:hypothetical protein
MVGMELQKEGVRTTELTQVVLIQGGSTGQGVSEVTSDTTLDIYLRSRLRPQANWFQQGEPFHRRWLSFTSAFSFVVGLRR